MSMDIDTQLKTIQAKLQQVLKQYVLLQKENARLKKELSKSQQNNSEKAEQLQALQQQVDVLKLGVSGWNDQEKAELEKRIDVYLKEIDKCIALLNN
jgi:phage host-nuclease inhibitor protein Gam